MMILGYSRKQWLVALLIANEIRGCIVVALIRRGWWH